MFKDARAAADRLLPSVNADGETGDPLPIVNGGWFVPVLRDARLTGFFQFDEALTFLRFSAFPSPIDPRLWLDPDAIRDRALRAYPNESADGPPFLTWDGNVTRLVWAVPVTGGTIYVAGDYAYRA